MPPTLFRPQALAARNNRLGAALPWTLPRLGLLAGALICCFIGAGVLVLQLEYADKVSVSGTVQPSARPVAVHSTHHGVVKAVLVVPGQVVSAGSGLLLIDTRHRAPDGSVADELELQRLRAQQAALEGARERHALLAAQEQQRMQQRRRSLLAQHETTRSQVGLLEQRLALAESRHTRLRRLANAHWVSDSDTMRSEQDVLVVREAKLGAQRGLQALLAESEQVRLDAQLHRMQTQHRLTELADEIRQMEYAIGQVAVRGEILTVAPVAGRVVELVAHEGKQLVPGMPMLTISPPSTAHVVEVYLPSSAAGRVRSAMPVRLRYSGYPYQEFGAGVGEIAAVGEVNSELGDAPVFRAEVRVVDLPAGIDRTPAGMSVQADVVLARRPLWSWLAEPLNSALSRL